MTGFTCNACNKEFIHENAHKIHFKSEWHRYNLKRKIAGLPGVTEALFLARQSAIAEENSKLNDPPMLYTCGLCGKGYRSSNAHAQHLKSRAHTTWASQANHQDESTAIIKPLPSRMVNKFPQYGDEESDEWEEVDQNVDLLFSNHMEMDGLSSDVDMVEDEDEDELDPTCCFMCDRQHETIESCMIHMHKNHGFFVPDVEYLKDPAGFLTYLGLKVKHDYMCLYCNSNCQPFNSLEAVRKHMVAKSHCRVHYGDDDGEAELDEFYDYSSSYVDRNGKQLVASDDSDDRVALGSGGSELIITRLTNDGISTKSIGSREYLRYYRQKPHPSPNSITITARYRSMGLSTVQSKEKMVRMKVMKRMNRSGVEAMRSKIGMNSNIIRNLPKNVTH